MNPERHSAVAFFDIGDTLASVRVNPGAGRIEEMIVLPGVLDALAALRSDGVSMGIISNRGSIPAVEVQAALDRAGLLEFLETALILYGVKDSEQIFQRAATAARAVLPVTPTRLLFVGEDATERGFAKAAGFLVSPHPSLAPAVLRGDGPLRFLRIRVPPSIRDPGDAAEADWRALLRDRSVVALHLVGAPATELYAVADVRTALDLDDLGFLVDRLGGDDEPTTSELYLVRDDGRTAGAFGTSAGSAGADARDAARLVLASTSEGLVVAVPGGRSIESLHLGDPLHGHNLKLTPSPALLDAEIEAVDSEAVDIDAVERVSATTNLVTPTVTDAEVEIIEQTIDAGQLERDVDRYSGRRPIAAGRTLRSRHVHHVDNQQAVDALIADLEGLDSGRLTVRSPQFTHEGRALRNVEATLAGNGLLGTVLVTAHLDSTAAREPNYRADRDPAPGADDDASGTAAVLAAARALLALDSRFGVPRRELRFVLFNAEEHGLVGSLAYARDQSLRRADIVAVLQLDMIGFDAVPDRTFELHAGFSPSVAIEQRSLDLAELVAAQVSCFTPSLPAPQTYPGTGGGRDPAEQRSDHYSFQRNGYPAVLASEDFFVGPDVASPAPDANPNYHAAADQRIDPGFVRDITRVVTAAAWLSATR